MRRGTITQSESPHTFPSTNHAHLNLTHPASLQLPLSPARALLALPWFSLHLFVGDGREGWMDWLMI